MQITLDISGKHRELFDDRVGIPGDAFHINVQGQEGYDIVFRNVGRFSRGIPKGKRNEILITGAAPRWVALAAAAAASQYFKVTKHYDGKEIIILRQQPPANLPQSDEAEG